MKRLAVLNIIVILAVSCKTAHPSLVKGAAQGESAMVDVAGRPLDFNDKMYTLWLPYSGPERSETIRVLFPNDRDPNGGQRVYRAYNLITAVKILNTNPGQYTGVAVTTGDVSKPYYLLKGREGNKNYYGLSFKNPKKTANWNTAEQLVALRSIVGSPDVRADYLIFTYDPDWSSISPTNRGKLFKNRFGYTNFVNITNSLTRLYERNVSSNKNQPGFYKEYFEDQGVKDGMRFWRQGNYLTSSYEGDVDVTYLDGTKFKEVYRNAKRVSTTPVKAESTASSAEAALPSPELPDQDPSLIDLADPEDPATQATDPFVTFDDQKTGNPFANPNSASPDGPAADAADGVTSGASSDANSQDSSARSNDASHAR